MRLIITNETKYKTADLRRLFCKALSLNNKIEGKPDLFRRLFIRVVYGGYSGNAYLGTGTMKIRIPNYINSTYKSRNNLEVDPKYIAWVFTHELYHCRGFRHRPLSKSIMEYSNKEGEWNWAIHYPIGKQEKKLKPKGDDLRIVRYTHVCKMVTEKQRQIKRLQNQLKKWNTKKKYYERQLPMAASKQLK
jgi:hypothetical protein